MDVKKLQWELAAFVAERGLESRHTPKSLAMALVGEGGTLLDIFKWLSDEESRQVGRQEREAAAAAIAEIFLHALRLADELGIDVEEAVAKKGAKLGGKPPAERRPEAPPAAAPSVERPAKPAASRPIPLNGPPSVRPASRSATPAPDFPRVRQPPDAPPDFPRVRQAPPAPTPDFPRVRQSPAAPPPEFPRVRQAPAAPPPDVPRVRPAASAAAPARAATIPPSSRAAPPSASRPAPAARPAPPPPPPPSEPLPEAEPYADLDLDAVAELVKSLAKRIDAAQSEDPIMRELHDELGTLRRTLYSKTFKRAWIGASLKSVRTMLGAALQEDIGEEIKARQHVAEIDRLLGD